MSVVTDYLSALPSAEREAVLGGNAQRFWKISVAVGSDR
jgi:predicted TIM-barrel fold metal-dependent hydrolase